jgi:hypothetical protein
MWSWTLTLEQGVAHPCTSKRAGQVHVAVKVHVYDYDHTYVDVRGALRHLS